MSKNILLAILVVLVVGTVGWMAKERFAFGDSTATEHGVPVTVYKSPYCGCCEKWSSYMDGEGYAVTEIEQEDMSAIKARFSVPQELESCHTAEIDGYVVEGHIPNEAIEKLLTERPDIKGIGMAGMPSGSPGMPGLKEDFMIYEIRHDGTKGNLFMQL